MERAIAELRVSYHLRVWWWQARRARLARRLTRRGESRYTVISELHKDALQHPHPVG